jgi:hypothetical protein
LGEKGFTILDVILLALGIVAVVGWVYAGVRNSKDYERLMADPELGVGQHVASRVVVTKVFDRYSCIVQSLDLRDCLYRLDFFDVEGIPYPRPGDTLFFAGTFSGVYELSGRSIPSIRVGSVSDYEESKEWKLQPVVR